MGIDQMAVAVSEFYRIAAVVNVIALTVVFHRLGYTKLVTALPLVSAVVLTTVGAGLNAAYAGMPWFEFPGRLFLQASMFCMPVFLVILALTVGGRVRSLQNA